jgi:hypothetical protein
MNAELHTRRAHKEDRDRIAEHCSAKATQGKQLSGRIWPLGHEKPQPVKSESQPWTAELVETMVGSAFSEHRDGYGEVAAAHNSALAAERETARQIKTAWDDLSIEHGKLQHELAAATDALRNLCNEVPREQCCERWQEADAALAKVAKQ